MRVLDGLLRVLSHSDKDFKLVDGLSLEVGGVVGRVRPGTGQDKFQVPRSGDDEADGECTVEEATGKLRSTQELPEVGGGRGAPDWPAKKSASAIGEGGLG